MHDTAGGTEVPCGIPLIRGGAFSAALFELGCLPLQKAPVELGVLPKIRSTRILYG
jgi:hypothetical protein